MAPTDVAGTTQVRAASLNPPTMNTWIHLTGVYDPSTGMRLYVNGVREGTNAAMPTWHATGPLRVGRTSNSAAPADYWVGGVDEVRILAGAMNDAQVADLYHEF